MNKTKASNIATGRLKLTRGLRQLREQAREMGDYSPSRPTLQLDDGSWLELTMLKDGQGSQLLGCWIIFRHWPDGRRSSYKTATSL